MLVERIRNLFLSMYILLYLLCVEFSFGCFLLLQNIFSGGSRHICCPPVLCCTFVVGIVMVLVMIQVHDRIPRRHAWRLCYSRSPPLSCVRFVLPPPSGFRRGHGCVGEGRERSKQKRVYAELMDWPGLHCVETDPTPSRTEPTSNRPQVPCVGISA